MNTHLLVCRAADGLLRERHLVFLALHGLRPEPTVDLTVFILDEAEQILACGSLYHNVLKQIAVSGQWEGEGLCAQIVSALIEEAARSGHTHLFLYTKPQHRALFHSLGFHPIVSTGDMLMMENRRDGIARFLAPIPRFEGGAGCIVCNCDPFTLGHRRLMETASRQSANVYVFVLSAGGFFPPDVRLRLVREGVSDLKNITVLPGSDYLVSPATFPTYFIKEEHTGKAQCALDIALFSTVIAPALGITHRYVGEEPFDPVTRQYNEQMKQELPRHGITLCEIPRYRAISASEVRRLIKGGELTALNPLLPEVSYHECVRRFG